MTTRDRFPGRLVRATAWAAVMVAAHAQPVTARQEAELTAAEARGREIYQTGSSPNGDPIVGYFGADRLELPGESLTCGRCHGYDGTGRPESGIVPSNVTWPYLTKSYGHRHDSGLEHGPFTAESVESYLRTGIYPGGARGDRSMPLYEMSDRDLHDLVSYLERLGQIQAPGVSDTSIRLGTVVPKTGPTAEIGRSIAGILAAQLAAVNDGGGIYGRTLELRVYELAGSGGPDLDAVRRWLAEEQPFALVSPFVPDPSLDADSLLASEGAPLIGPFTLYPVESFFDNRNVFYIFSGLGDQVRALVRQAAETGSRGEAKVAVLSHAADEANELAEVVVAACREAHWPAPRIVALDAAISDTAETVAELAADGTDVVVLLAAPSENRSFLEAAAASDWRPTVLLPGILAGELVFEAPISFDQHLYLAYPTLPGDRKDSAMRELIELMRANDVPPNHSHAVISASAAAKIVVAALREAGRDLSRERFIAALEGLYQLDTGLTPRLTYTRNRRVGTGGAWVVRLDAFRSGPQGLSAAHWVDSR